MIKGLTYFLPVPLLFPTTIAPTLPTQISTWQRRAPTGTDSTRALRVAVLAGAKHRGLRAVHLPVEAPA